MADDLATGATNAMEIPGIGGIMSSIPGLAPGAITPQPHVMMPPIPKPMMQDPISVPQNMSGKPLNRHGESKANKLGAVAAGLNMVGKYTNKMKEEKYQSIQFDMQRLMEAAQIANDPSMPPEVRKQNEDLVNSIMRGKHGKDISKIMGDINPFGESKDPRGQKAFQAASQAVQQKTGLKQYIGNLLKAVGGRQQGGTPIPGGPNAAPQGNLNSVPSPMPSPMPMASPSIPGAPPAPMTPATNIIGAANSAFQPGKLNPNQGTSASNASAPASAVKAESVQTPTSAAIMKQFPTVPGISRSAQLQMEYMKEFQPLLVEQMKLNTELARVGGNLELADKRIKGAILTNTLKIAGMMDLEKMKLAGKMTEDQYKYMLKLKEIDAKHKAAMAELKPTQKASLLNTVTHQIEAEIGNLTTTINEMTDPTTGQPKAGVNPKTYDDLKQRREMFRTQYEGVIKDTADVAHKATGYDNLKNVGENIGDVLNRFKGLLDDSGRDSIYGPLINSNAATNATSSSETSDESDNEDE